jgi:hypothetical protein
LLDFGASVAAIKALEDMVVSTERFSKQRVHHLQNFQLTENEQAVAEAHWIAIHHRREYREDAEKVDEV